MTMMAEYQDLHEKVDQLRPEQVGSVRNYVNSLLTPRANRKFSYIASGVGPSDLAERAEYYLTQTDEGTE